MIVEVTGQYECKNCGNVFVWYGLSMWGERSLPANIWNTTLHENESRATEWGEPQNGIYCFKIYCPKCYQEEIAYYNPETDEYFEHFEHT